ncbi:hypothetical protein F0562_031533 [Nyssa sinensis]|uniref:Lipoyl-binding domain-containing protein n=1 Tax=Nyssa sinensis TaxID=561372 RepID=A0A5J5AVW9_9ASTE|nr:hypothetical protein F0562_031533 [Nyssa sinensis]
MESAAVLRSLNCTISHGRSVLERHGMIHVCNASWPTSSKLHFQGLTFGGKLVFSPKKWEGTLVSCVKTSESAVTSKSDGSSDGHPQGSLEKKSLRNVKFPDGFEELILKVCDETEVAELKLKVGDFEMHLKRNIGAPAAPPSLPPKSSPEKISPFTNVSLEKSAKLAALEASGSRGYVLVSSPTVGSFRRGRTLKGKKQPPICKEGDIIKEGQVIGFLDQFGTELPVRSDVAGEVLKLLFNDGGEGIGMKVTAMTMSVNLQFGLRM